MGVVLDFPRARSTAERPLSGRELGARFGVKKRTVQRWQAAGCPSWMGLDGERKYLFSAVASWRARAKESA